MTPETRGGVRPTRWRLAIHALPLAVPVIVILVVGFTHRTTADDGFIYYRIVHQITHGNGPVFNAGERVEVFTSPAWVAILSFCDIFLPIRLEWIGALLGLGFTAIGLSAAMAGALRLTADRNGEASSRVRAAVPAGALVVIAPFGMWIWVTSGLETSLVWAWLGFCLYLLSPWAGDDRPVRPIAAVVLGLGWLIRPELGIFSALFVAVLLVGQWRTSSWRARLRLVGTMAAAPLAYQIFRMGYYGSVVANTAIAKEGTTFRWDRGTSYLHDFVDPYWLWIPVALLILAGYVPLFARALGRQRLVAGAYLVGATFLAVYVVAIGGDYFHARFFVPALFALCAPVAAVTLQRRFLALPLVAPWAVAALVFLRPPQLQAPTFAFGTIVPRIYGDVTIDDVGWGGDGPYRQWYHGRDLYIETGGFGLGYDTATFEPADDVRRPAVVVDAIGAVSYALGPDVRIIDLLNLADPVGSHFEAPETSFALPGHEKPTPAAWLAAELAAPGQDLRPDAYGPATITLIPIERGAAFEQQVADARAVLRCPPLRRLQDAATGHLGPRRFLLNIVRSPSNTARRIPPDPTEARRQLC